MDNIDFSSEQYYTDLALETRDLVRGATGQEIAGVIEDKQTFPYGSITIIKIEDEAAEKVMGKPRGTYITIEAPELKYKSLKFNMLQKLCHSNRNLLHLKVRKQL